MPATTIDPLSAPSGFTTAPRAPDALFLRPWQTNGNAVGAPSNVQHREEGEPPRKRLNRGDLSTDPIDLFSVPDSPEVQRLGQRRRTNTNSWMSSDESLSEIDKNDAGAGPSRPRIIRGQPSEAGTSVPATPSSVSTEPATDSETQFKRFRILNQFEHTEARLRHAWQTAKGDEREATKLLQDPSFQVPAPVAVAKPKPPRPTVETGKVKEVEEASKAERARVKEMGKKSAIYANFALKTSTPPPSKANGERSIPPHTPATPVTPASPEVVRPRVKRLKRKIVDSDSELELSDDSEEEKRISKREETSEENALGYFNTASAEALQELTGTCLFVVLGPLSLISPCVTRLLAGTSQEDC